MTRNNLRCEFTEVTAILIPDIQKKKQIHKNYLKSKKIIYALPYVILALALVFSIVLLIYGFGNDTAFIVSDNTDSDFGKKNIMLLCFILGTVDIILAFFFIVIKIAIYRIVGKSISERVNESLLIKKDCIEYGYQNYAGAFDGDRVVVRIPFAYISKITYNSSTKEIIISGKYSSKYYEDYKTKYTRADDLLISGNFAIFDYFEPSLIDFLVKVGLQVTRVE